MSKRMNDDDYTYLEWVTSMRQWVNLYFDQEVARISHDREDERPWELINKVRTVIKKFESQIPDDITE